jgi:hypothetical protein
MISAAYVLLCLPALADAFIPSGISAIAPRGTRTHVAHSGRARSLGLRMVASPPEAEGSVSRFVHILPLFSLLLHARHMMRLLGTAVF